MTVPQRVRCAAADFWGDKHQAVDRWWTVTDPEGRQFDLCSGACLVAYSTLGALPVDAEQRNPMHGRQPHGSDEVAA